MHLPRIPVSVFGPPATKSLRGKYHRKAEEEPTLPGTPKPPAGETSPPPEEVAPATESAPATPPVVPPPIESEDATTTTPNVAGRPPEDPDDPNEHDRPPERRRAPPEPIHQARTYSPIEKSLIQGMKEGSRGQFDQQPFLIYADWLAENGRDEEGEAIRLQLLLHDRNMLDWDRRREVSERLRDLLADHLEWYGPWGNYDPFGTEGLDGSAVWNYGLLSVKADLHGDDDLLSFLDENGEEDSMAPVSHLTLSGDADAVVKSLKRTTWIRYLNSLSLADTWFHDDLGYFDQPLFIAKTLANAPEVENLILLNLEDTNFHGSALDVLARSPQLRNLRVLKLGRNPLLQVSLTDEGNLEDGIDSLLTSPYLTKLERLDLTGIRIPPPIREVIRRRFGPAAEMDYLD